MAAGAFIWNRSCVPSPEADRRRLNDSYASRWFLAGNLNFFDVLGFRSPITLFNFKIDGVAF